MHAKLYLGAAGMNAISNRLAFMTGPVADAVMQPGSALLGAQPCRAPKHGPSP